MKNLSELTVIILTYLTPKKVLFDCIKSIDKNVNILIIENSKNFQYQNLIDKEFLNVKIICTGKNLGYGAGNNIGIKNSLTKYVLILNPDTICDKNFFSFIPSVINEAKDFAVIGCQYLIDKIYMPAGFFNEKQNKEFIKEFRDEKVNPLTRVEWVTGCSMLINLNEFQKKDLFDENFFLYFEEFDLCKSLVRNNKKIYTSNKLRVHHLGFKSSLNDNHVENLNTNNLREWHFMWSSFYFYKKNFSYIYALRKLSGKFLRSFLRLIFYSITYQKDKRNKYLYRFLGLFNSIMGRPSKFR